MINAVLNHPRFMLRANNAVDIAAGTGYLVKALDRGLASQA
ncbi:MAG: hypothetical protein ACXV79_08495 [Methylobacter sp.]